MSAHCCHDHPPHQFHGASSAYRRTLGVVAAANAAMFLVEASAGLLAGSLALQADALDFAADAATYGASLWAISRPPRTRATVALAKGASLALMAAFVLGASVWRVLAPGLPEAATMGAVGFLALAVNVGAATLLFRWRDGDANVRSVWLCTRNDAIGNVAVMFAAALVWVSASFWPDVIVAAAMAALFLASAVRIVRQSLAELRAPGALVTSPPASG